MESNTGPGEEMALSEIITCPPGDESGQNANQEPSDDLAGEETALCEKINSPEDENGQHANQETSDGPAGEMTGSCMDKLSQKINTFCS